MYDTFDCKKDYSLLYFATTDNDEKLKIIDICYRNNYRFIKNINGMNIIQDIFENMCILNNSII